MGIKTILVHLESENQTPHLLNAAVRLADQHNAHLIGTYVFHPLEPYVARASEAAAGGEIAKIVMKEEIKRATALEELFHQACKEQNFVSEWRLDNSLRGSVQSGILEQAGTSDLLLVSSVIAGDSEVISKTDLGSIITHNSRPTLIVPQSYADKSLGKYIFVAWDGSSESSRAVFDALPLLQSASDVWLHRVKSNDESKRHDDDVTRQLADSLARHDVKIEMSESTSSARKVGSEILSRAQDRGADSLVMGAYGHGRLHRFFLGNATGHILEHSNIPVLMSH